MPPYPPVVCDAAPVVEPLFPFKAPPALLVMFSYECDSGITVSGVSGFFCTIGSKETLVAAYGFAGNECRIVDMT